MNSDSIRLELYKRRKIVRMADIARKLNVTDAAVSRVIDRLSTSARIQRAVADAIGRSREEVFPETTSPN